MKTLTMFIITLLISSVLFTACSSKSNIIKSELKVDQDKINKAHQELNRELKNK